MSPLNGARRWATVLLAVATIGCSSADGAENPAEPGPAPASTSATTRPTPGAIGGAATTSTTPPPPQVPTAPEPTVAVTVEPTPTEPVVLAFGGDVHFEGELDGKVRNDPAGMLSAISPVLSQADVAAVNLETAVTDRGEPAPKQYNFAAPATAFEALQAAGVDTATLANNHGMDFGQTGLGDTLDAAAAADFPLLGAGSDEAQAYAPWVTHVKGRDIAFIGATQVLDSFAIEAWTAGPDKPGLASAKENGLDKLVASVRAAETSADTVVVFLHWGREGDSCPLPRQPELARTLVDAGADIVVGGHAHRLQGAGFLDEAYIAYGLGNFVFYTQSGPGTSTGVLTVRIEADDSLHADWVPAVIQGGVPVPLEDDAADAARTAWEDLRGCTDLAAQPE